MVKNEWLLSLIYFKLLSSILTLPILLKSSLTSLNSSGHLK